MKTYFAFYGDSGEVLVLPSVTPNTSQKRIGIRIGTETIWLRSETVNELAKVLKEQAKP